MSYSINYSDLQILNLLNLFEKVLPNKCHIWFLTSLWYYGCKDSNICITPVCFGDCWSSQFLERWQCIGEESEYNFMIIIQYSDCILHSESHIHLICHCLLNFPDSMACHIGDGTWKENLCKTSC